ncbi:BatA domain-containing protein [Stenotrophomonas sp. Iso1]|uniref:BatA domain-containing protein n=1 Tax=Stenotrophomonas sp. Iso1 TaxID=2977283 RepID=UPI0022B7D26E|nr:BatA domain-containing protein [Stenotrophomonas sp. Iso1]
MSLLWLFPAGFLALAALLLPLLIHLARRDQQQLIDFAALRWLSAKPRPRRRIRFDEWPLLLVRLLLLALLALLLARPALNGLIDATPRVAVLPGLELAKARAAVDAPQAKWLWLAKDFPRIDEGTAAPPANQPVASLLRELDATLPPEAPLTVIVPSVLQDLDAQRPRLSRVVQWQIVESPAATPAATKTTAPQLQVRHDEAGTAALRYLRAVNQAWHPDAALDSRQDSRLFDDGAAVRVWLSARSIPDATLAWTRTGGTLLVDARTPIPADAQRTTRWHDDNGNVLLEQISHANARWLRWTTALDATSMPSLLDAHFPQQLQAQLQASPSPGRATAAAMSPHPGADAYPQPARELAPWLILAIALLFLLERWMATARRRRGHA